MPGRLGGEKAVFKKQIIVSGYDDGYLLDKLSRCAI
jgi:hypothetical protein